VASQRHTGAAVIVGTAIVLTIGFGATSSAQVVVAGAPYPYPYPYSAPDASVRFDVKPKEAAVYIDGYYAGLVDDYDGTFQRLRTTPGGHELTLFLEGYRTHTEHVYLSADNTFKMRFRLEKLAAGDLSERPPAPQPPPQFQPGQPGPSGQGGQPPVSRRAPRPERYPPNGPDNLPPPPPPTAEGQPERPDAANGRGTLALTLQPGDAEVLVDGTPWRTDGSEHLTLDLTEGHHNIQIRKAGFVGYLTDVQVRRGETTMLDVQLKTQPR
jgi:PEGA domain